MPIESTALQLALCYELGFGVLRDENKSIKALQKMTPSKTDLKEAMSFWKHKKRDRNLLQKEYMPYANDYTYYLEGKCLEQAEVRLCQELQDVEQSLGVENELVCAVKSQFSRLLSGQGRWKETETLQLQVLETSKKMFGPEHSSTLISMSNLAGTYSHQGRWKEAEELQLQVLAVSKKIFGPEHPYSLTSMTNLAGTYSHQGRLKEAEELQLQVLAVSKETLGPDYPGMAVHSLI